MSEARIAELRQLLAEARQRIVDFQAYPDIVELAKKAEQDTIAELEQLGEKVEKTATPAKKPAAAKKP